MTDAQNLLAWMAQTIVLASAAAILPALFRLRHPRTQIAYCHLALAACLILPAIEPWQRPRPDARRPVSTEVAVQPLPASPAAVAHSAKSVSSRAVGPSAPAVPVVRPRRPVWTGIGARPIVLWIATAGFIARLCWLVGGLWRIRRYRIAAVPLYPAPESIAAASAVVHADALFCLSPEVPGPVMLGWLAPVVLLPESFLSLDEEAQCGIACHELLHVRRGDWLATLGEEVVAALLWFNPAAWVLLANVRLAREQLVDAETVRLTAAREPYINALLAIARRPTYDLAPAPVFLRRRHLTRRVHSLLRETSMSRFRLLSSYGSMTAILVLAGWCAWFWFPLAGLPQVALAEATPAPIAIAPASVESAATVPTAAAPESAGKKTREPLLLAFQVPQTQTSRFAEAPPRLASVPVLADPHELVTGSIKIASSPADRAAALALLERARQNGLTHRAGSAPYKLEATFSAAGSAVYTGSGQLAETWLSGSKWLWTASLGDYSVTRTAGFGTATGEIFPGAIPMRLHMLRNAIFWGVQSIPNSQIRTASVQVNGRPATCMLLSGIVDPTEQTRLWEESESCIDNASGLLQVHSIAPGTYTIYGYDRNLQFHGLAMPDHISIYVNGALVLDAQVFLTDAGTIDESQLRPTQEMIDAGPVVTGMLPARFPIEVPNASVSGLAKPVIVHASVDGSGKVVEWEISSAADPALEQTALNVVKYAKFAVTNTQQQMYINVRFVPESH